MTNTSQPILIQTIQYSALRKELSTDARCNLNEPENAMLSEKKKSQTITNYMIPFIENIQNR